MVSQWRHRTYLIFSQHFVHDVQLQIGVGVCLGQRLDEHIVDVTLDCKVEYYIRIRL